MQELSRQEIKQLDSQSRPWYLKSNLDKTWFVYRSENPTKSGKLNMDEIYEILISSDNTLCDTPTIVDSPVIAHK